MSLVMDWFKFDSKLGICLLLRTVYYRLDICLLLTTGLSLTIG